MMLPFPIQMPLNVTNYTYQHKTYLLCFANNVYEIGETGCHDFQSNTTTKICLCNDKDMCNDTTCPRKVIQSHYLFQRSLTRGPSYLFVRLASPHIFGNNCSHQGLKVLNIKYNMCYIHSNCGLQSWLFML